MSQNQQFLSCPNPLHLVALTLSLALTGCTTQNAPSSAVATRAESAMDVGDHSQAVTLFSQAIEKDQQNPLLYAERGSAYNGLHKFNDALKDFDEALSKIRNPKDERLAYIYYHRGYAYELEGMKKEGLDNYQKAIAVDPAFPDAHGNAAWILATHPDASIRNPSRALEYAKYEAKASKMKDTAVLDTLAAAYAVNGLFDDAVTIQKKALMSAEDHEDKFNFAERLKLYQQKKTYIEPLK